jgi:hypothetical protein
MRAGDERAEVRARNIADGDGSWTDRSRYSGQILDGRSPARASNESVPSFVSTVRSQASVEGSTAETRRVPVGVLRRRACVPGRKQGIV